MEVVASVVKVSAVKDGEEAIGLVDLGHAKGDKGDCQGDLPVAGLGHLYVARNPEDDPAKGAGNQVSPATPAPVSHSAL